MQIKHEQEQEEKDQQITTLTNFIDQVQVIINSSTPLAQFFNTSSASTHTAKLLTTLEQGLVQLEEHSLLSNEYSLLQSTYTTQ
jgi:hypothetical protein